MGFLLDGEVLYKKEKDQILLRCVDSSEANRIVEEIHKGVCGTHANGHRMAGQVMRTGYYWLTLENDYIKYARECHKCRQDSCTSNRATCHGTSVAFLIVGHGRHWTYHLESF